MAIVNLQNTAESQALQLQSRHGRTGFSIFFVLDSIVLFVGQTWFRATAFNLNSPSLRRVESERRKEKMHITTSFVALSPCKHAKWTCEMY